MSAKPRRREKLALDDPLPPEDHRPIGPVETAADLYRKHGGRLARFLSRRVDPEHAPDLMHNVFARFLGLAPLKRSGIVSAEAYLMRSARNLARDEHKIGLRRGAGQHISDEDACLTSPCQITALEARDMLNRIEQSIRKLKPITQQIFLAHRLDGYSYAEIAVRTGLRVKTVEKHMSRAIAHLDRTVSAR